MQEVFEKIIEKLEAEQKSYEAEHAWNYAKGLEYAAKIVEQAAAEYNNGWIPCNIEMPKEHESIFSRYKGTKEWNDCMFEKISDEVSVTVSDEKGHRTTSNAHTVDGKWSCDLLKANKSYQIIAWQKLPQPYQPMGE